MWFYIIPMTIILMAAIIFLYADYKETGVFTLGRVVAGVLIAITPLINLVFACVCVAMGLLWICFQVFTKLDRIVLFKKK